MKHWILLLFFVFISQPALALNPHRRIQDYDVAASSTEPSGQDTQDQQKEESSETYVLRDADGDVIRGKNNGEPKDDFDSPFSMYNENYLLLGWDDSYLNQGFIAKFQVSAKFAFPVKGLFFGYTQRSFMDVLEDSTPLYDNNYMPEFYYVYTFSDKFTNKHKVRFLKAGYIHESNGREGLDSRSWERLYAEASFEFGGLYIQPMAWFPFFKDTQNPDITRYYGYGEINAGYIWPNDIQLSGRVRKGTDLKKGNVKIDFSVPFTIFDKELPKGWSRSYMWLQVWQGYGESYIGYREATTAVAAGVGFRPEP